jgi:CheW-like domain
MAADPAFPRSDLVQGSGQFSTFFVDDLFFGVDVLNVQEVLRFQQVTPVPQAPGVIEGLINLRGQIVTAIDMRRRLGFPQMTHRSRPSLERTVMLPHSGHGRCGDRRVMGWVSWNGGRIPQTWLSFGGITTERLSVHGIRFLPGPRANSAGAESVLRRTSSPHSPSRPAPRRNPLGGRAERERLFAHCAWGESLGFR